MTKTMLAAAAIASCLTALPAMAEVMPIHATMNNASEVPPTKGDGSGTMTGTLDTTTGKLDYTVTYKNLTGPAIMEHFHGPALPGANAGVIVPLTPGAPSPITGTATLTPAQIADLEAGKYYVNVHTAENKGGEIRGQVEKGK
jgi:hypothetical protein